MMTQLRRRIWESCSIWQKFSTRRSSHQPHRIVWSDAEDLLVSQALRSGSETDMPNLLCIHLPCAFLRMHSHSKSQPLAKLLVWNDFWPAFRMPFLSPLCCFSLHPISCEASDSFSFVSSIWQDILEKKDKCSNRTFLFCPRGGRGKQTPFAPYFFLFILVSKLEDLGCFFSLTMRSSDHWVLTVHLFVC